MHYYKRNLGDYAKKAGRLTMLQHGSYTLLIDACYDREKFPTLQEAIEWTWASTAAEMEAVEFVLRKFFVPDGAVFVQKRIQEELAEYHAKALTNKRIAVERESSRRSEGTKRARKPDDTAPEVHDPSPGVHDPSTEPHAAPPNQEPPTNNHEPVYRGEERAARTPPCDAVKPNVLKPDGVDQQTWSDWLTLRKAKRAPVTVTVVNSAIQEAAKASLPLEDFLAIWCARGTQGLQAEWIKPEERSHLHSGPASRTAPAAWRAEPAWRTEERMRMQQAAPDRAAQPAANFSAQAAASFPAQAAANFFSTMEVTDVSAKCLG